MHNNIPNKRNSYKNSSGVEESTNKAKIIRDNRLSRRKKKRDILVTCA